MTIKRKCIGIITIIFLSSLVCLPLAYASPPPMVELNLNQENIEGAESQNFIVCIDEEMGNNYWSEPQYYEDWKDHYGNWTYSDFLSRRYKDYTRCIHGQRAGLPMIPEKIAVIFPSQNKSYESGVIETDLPRNPKEDYILEASLKEDGSIEVNDIRAQGNRNSSSMEFPAFFVILVLLTLVVEILVALLYTRKKEKLPEARLVLSVVFANLATFSLILVAPSILSGAFSIVTLVLPFQAVAILHEAIIIYIVNSEIKILKSFLLSILINIVALFAVQIPVFWIFLSSTGFY